MKPYDDQAKLARQIRKHWKRALCTKGAWAALKAEGIR